MLTHLNWLDYVLFGITFISIVFGILRGFLREVLSLITWIAAFFVAIMYSDALARYLAQYIKTEILSSIVSFLFLFIVTLIIGALLSYIITKIVAQVGLMLSDRMLGAIFGLGRGALIVILIVFLISNTTFQKQVWFQQSMLSNQLKGTTSWLQSKMDVFKDQIKGVKKTKIYKKIQNLGKINVKKLNEAKDNKL